ncbi:MAG: AraC family transcriptional regulator [Pseudomonadota bacterium]
MIFFDTYFRVAAATLLLIQIILIIRDAWDVRPARFGALLCIGLLDVVGSDNSTHIDVPLALQYVLSAFSMTTAIFIWWFSLSLFNDEFRLRRLEWSVAAVWFILGLFNYNAFVQQEPLPHFWAALSRTGIAVVLVAHIVYTALAGRRSDLVESRRRVRTLFAFSIAALFLTDLITEYAFGFHAEPIWASMLKHGAYFFVILWSVLWLNKLDKRVLMFDKPAPATAPTAPALSPKEKLLHEKLIGIVEGDKAYLEPELSIAALSARMEAPEHQVRALINKAMGYRNFRSFLNGYRMSEAKAALSDPQKAALPILTIAMDSGFASLSSFNRAFRDAENETPTAFRQRALSGT